MKNLLVIGDNLQFLRIVPDWLKVDMIYIDPPYNKKTKCFTYKDRKTTENWIRDMYARLVYVKKLLKEDGVIFISIDDSQQARLKLLCDQTLGANNFCGQFIWKSRSGPSNDCKVFSTDHEYILVYAADKSKVKKFNGEIDESKYKLEDKWIETRGRYHLEGFSAANKKYGKSLDYEIIAPDGSKIYPNAANPKIQDKYRWMWSKDTFEKRKAEDRVVFKKTKNGWRVYYKLYLNEDSNGKPRVHTVRSIINGITNSKGTSTLRQMPNLSLYKLEDKWVKTRGPHYLADLSCGTIGFRENLIYEIECPDGTKLLPNFLHPKIQNKYIWRWSKDTFEKMKSEDRVVFKKIKNSWRIKTKIYLNEDKKGNPRVHTVRSLIEGITNSHGSKTLRQMIGPNKFTYPKPVELIQYLLKIFGKKDALILDFYAGSGTTGHAVLGVLSYAQTAKIIYHKMLLYHDLRKL